MGIFEQFKCLKVDRTVKAIIGMSREKFDKLALVFAKSYDETQQERLKNQEIKKIRSGGLQGVFKNHEERLFFLLYYLKTYPTFDNLGFHFDLSPGHAHDYIKAYMPILERALINLNVFPNRNFETIQDFKQVIENLDEIIVDGVEVPCVRPSDKATQEARYSGKKNATRSRG